MYLKKSNKTAVSVDTMSPDEHAYGKYRNPFYLPDFVSGSHAWGTRDLEPATEPSPHSADGSSPAEISFGEFSAAGLWKAPLDGP